MSFGDPIGGRVDYPFWESVHDCRLEDHPDLSFPGMVTMLFSVGLQRYEDASQPGIHIADYAGSKRSITLVPKVTADEEVRLSNFSKTLKMRREELVAVFIKIGFREKC